MTFALFVAELANPFMYLRYLLRELGWKDTKLARTNQVRKEGGREEGRERTHGECHAYIVLFPFSHCIYPH